ncbi:MAG TPA: FG-GAP-like repeat-containing protein [Candidatus Eisenbacteria bacterium]|nr:FG-GAP-like repeat-containing protein [Candidatus Eisenbacteria bacterium]
MRQPSWRHIDNVFNRLGQVWGNCNGATIVVVVENKGHNGMGRRRAEPSLLNRRQFLAQLGYASPALLPAPFPLRAWPAIGSGEPRYGLSADIRLVPDYPARSPLDEMLRLVPAGTDACVTEKYAAELQIWFANLRQMVAGPGEANSTGLAQILDQSLEARELAGVRERKLPTGGAIALRKRSYAAAERAGKDSFVPQLLRYFMSLGRIETAEFEIVSLKQKTAAPLEIDAEVRYSLVGVRPNRSREERVGLWRMSWRQSAAAGWVATKWLFMEESAAQVAAQLFTDVSAQAFAGTDSYSKQLLYGADHWRTVLDGACGIDVYGNNGIAAGDFDGDGRDDIYACQPAGLPNRLYRNRGDGTFEDITEEAGVGILDPTACAVFADFENRGLQDLLVVCNSGPLLFLNQGNGTFAPKPGAFSFAKPPQGTFTHAAVADYDRDGRLDVYFCLYTYYLGLDQYHYPSPYFDARNGPPNFLFHNEGNARFVDCTEAARLNAENDRFSFACAWGDIAGSGGPDLYVANDFGRSNLYHNNGDGTFAAVSDEADVNVPGAGMSACWCDFDNDGKQDIYVSNMWSAAGQRVSDSEIFHARDSMEIRSFYRGHARGNCLYRNSGDGKFTNASESSGAARGRWAWSSDAWDFDHDGYSDLYVTNGYISGAAEPELSSFFWRQVVGNSPANAMPSASYEHGWNAINELIRSDHSWSGYERNAFYWNNREGSFSEVSGVSGLDLLEDSRAFALADLDGDGRLEVIAKNRNAPQIRVLHNVMTDIGEAVCFRLRGTKSNRDAIGAAITVRSGELRQTKYLQAGTGFLSQHTKEVFFGLGKPAGKITASVRWPSGLLQNFSDIPANHRVTIVEGKPDVSGSPFSGGSAAYSRKSPPVKPGPLPTAVSTWLLDPLPAPDFSLPDLSGKTATLAAFRGNPLLLTFWAGAAPLSVRQLHKLQNYQSEFTAKGLRIVSLNLDKDGDPREVRARAEKEKLSLRICVATAEVAGIYNILYRFLFDRRRDLPIPCTFLLDESGLIVKVYQGELDGRQILNDAASIPHTYAARVAKGLPFPGTLYKGQFKRNDFTYGVALFQHGYLDQAAESFKQVVAVQPENAEAYYNLGTLYLRKNDLQQAGEYLQQTVKLRSEYPEAWNNLGMIAGQQSRFDDAIRSFQRSLDQRPDYVTALLNLGNVYRRQGNMAESSRLLKRALELEPENSEANYSLGMLYARQNDLTQATASLRKSVALRPDYPDAINNLGVLYVRQGKNTEAEQQFAACIRIAPNFDQAYLNLARLYMLLQEKEKARQTLEALLKLQPAHKLAQQALEMLN